MPILPLLLAGCAADRVEVLIDPDGEHLLDAPFPSDDRTDLAKFPAADGVLGGVVGGWVMRVEQGTDGFAANGPAYFRTARPLELPPQTEGLPSDPVLMIELDTRRLIPLELSVVAQPADDPFWRPNTLSMLPMAGFAPRPGARVAAVLTRDAGVIAPDDYLLPDEVRDALRDVGAARGEVATTYTVQDGATQLRDLADAAIPWLDWGDPGWVRVTRLEYAPGETPSGKSATACTAHLADGSTQTAWLAANEHPAHTVELDDDWPTRVYVGEVQLPNFQGLDDRPYMSPGAAHLLDIDNTSGWIDATAPQLETMRVVLSVPPGVTDAPVVIWDHGTGGTAFNHVQRRHPDDDGRAIAQALADAGVVALAVDQPLYGTRYPLVDEGFTDGHLGFYNIVNLTALRDNHRQGGLEGSMLAWLARNGLEDVLPEGDIDPDRVSKGGHSLGAATSHSALAATPDLFDSAFLSGSSAVFAYSFLDSGLVGTDSAFVSDLGDLFGVTIGQDAEIGEVIAAALGIEDPDARQRLDRHHPVVMLFQWIMDPADPASIGPAEDVPTTVLLAVDDWQIPNHGTEALTDLMPDATLVRCDPGQDWDPHSCLYRHPDGHQLFADWLATLRD